MFTDVVGDLEEGERFVKYILDRDGQVVRLDVELTVQDVFEGGEGVPPNFTVWEKCAGTRRPDELSESDCVGWSFNLIPARTTDSSLYLGSGVHLDGYFLVNVRRNSLHMGRTFVTLKPLEAERAIELAGRRRAPDQSGESFRHGARRLYPVKRSGGQMV